MRLPKVLPSLFMVSKFVASVFKSESCGVVATATHHGLQGCNVRKFCLQKSCNARGRQQGQHL